MNETETQKTTSEEIPEVVAEETVVPEAQPEATATPAVAKKPSMLKLYLGAAVITLVIIFTALYFLEKEGRSSTNIFGSLIASQEAGLTVAVVNGEEIVNADLQVSIQQFGQMAAAQGVDITAADAQDEIRTQALDVLVNTELLKQTAVERGYVVTDEEIATRLEEITQQLGGEDVLAERLESLGITPEKLESDVRDEILIQSLLDDVFAEAAIEVTDEEIAEVYTNAGGADAGLPPLEEVSEQVKEQIVTSKEQALVDELLADLKVDAEIEVVEVETAE